MIPHIGDSFGILMKVEHLMRLARAQAELLICYRLGRRPSDKVLDTIAKYKHLIEKVDR